MKKIEFDGEYVSKWGLTDWYPESEKILRDVIESGEDFETEWLGCKKEIRYAKYARDEEGFVINVQSHMDDLFTGDDLIYDALWASCHSEKVLPDDTIDRIRSECIEVGIDDNTEFCVTLPKDASWDEIMEMTKKLENEVEENNQDMFNRLCEIVKNHVVGVII